MWSYNEVVSQMGFCKTRVFQCMYHFQKRILNVRSRPSKAKTFGISNSPSMTYNTAHQWSVELC